MAQAETQTEAQAIPAVEKAAAPILDLNFLSHGTLESRDLERSRAFYTEFLGLEVVRTSEISLLIRLGGPNTIAVVKSDKKGPMTFLNHNGIDVLTEADVDTAHAKVVEHADIYGLNKITRPQTQHGTYSFYFWDGDDNAWEILTNPKGGYSWLFERGDQEGRGHLDKEFERPPETRE
ncbi:MAG TPA: VOC family protein [Alphaproteobacteria bacterium]|nr:VOC family protein [Alphaproteobacteria bacterium]